MESRGCIPTMAHSENRLAWGSPLLSSASRSITGDLAPNNRSEHNARSAHLTAWSSAIPPKTPNDDKRVLGHSSGTSKDACSSFDVSHRSISPEINTQVCTQPDRIPHGPPVCENRRNTSFSQHSNLMPASDASSRVCVISPPRNPSMDMMHSKAAYSERSRDHSSSALSVLPRSSFDNDGHRNGESVNGVMAQNQSGLHHRSTSGTSELSTATCSSAGKPSSQYVHPMRQAPRTYTPPFNQSHEVSTAESDNAAHGDHVEEGSAAQWGLDSLHQSMRGSSGQSPRLSLQTQEDPFIRLHGTSQTNLTGRPSLGYSRDTGSMLDTASPISRSSLDFSFRTKTRTSMDPLSRAATVQAARQAFEEKEAAKARKLEEQQLKAEARQMRRKEKQPWRASPRQDEYREHAWPKDAPEVHGVPAPSRPASQAEPAPATWKPQPKNRWMHFLTWLRTRVFKIRRRVNVFG